MSEERKILYNWQKNDEESKKLITSGNIKNNNSKKVIPASNLFDSDEEITEKYADISKNDTSKISDELFVEAAGMQRNLQEG